jgi:acyl-CoA synthetase (NDP forming)
MVLGDANVDAAVAAFVPPLGIRQIDVAQSIVEARRRHPDKPVLAVLMGREGLPEGKAQLHDAGIPAYIFPESTARALAALYRYRQWLDRAPSEATMFAVDKERVSAILAAARAEGRQGLLEPEALAVLDAYGIATVEHRVALCVDEAVEAAEALGYPVVVKVLSPEVVHKTDVGGVRVDLRTADDVRVALAEIEQAVRVAQADANLRGWLVERFLKGGKETIVGVTLDPAFGPVVMFGLGGVYVEALGDVAFRIQPVSAQDARDMMTSLKGRSLLEGVRGEAAVDREALVEVVQRVSQLMGDHEDIAEMDINPLLAFHDGARAVDARLRLTTPTPHPPPHTAPEPG